MRRVRQHLFLVGMLIPRRGDALPAEVRGATPISRRAWIDSRKTK